MVWRAIVGNKKSKLVLMERNENASCQGHSALSYLQTMEDQLLELYDENK